MCDSNGIVNDIKLEFVPKVLLRKMALIIQRLTPSL